MCPEQEPISIPFLGKKSLKMWFDFSQSDLCMKANPFTSLLCFPGDCSPLGGCCCTSYSSKSSQAAGAGACTEVFFPGFTPVELRETGHILTDCLRGAQLNCGLFYGGVQ